MWQYGKKQTFLQCTGIRAVNVAGRCLKTMQSHIKHCLKNASEYLRPWKTLTIMFITHISLQPTQIVECNSVSFKERINSGLKILLRSRIKATSTLNLFQRTIFSHLMQNYVQHCVFFTKIYKMSKITFNNLLPQLLAVVAVNFMIAVVVCNLHFTTSPFHTPISKIFRQLLTHFLIIKRSSKFHHIIISGWQIPDKAFFNQCL